MRKGSHHSEATKKLISKAVRMANRRGKSHKSDAKLRAERAAFVGPHLPRKVKKVKIHTVINVGPTDV